MTEAKPNQEGQQNRGIRRLFGRRHPIEGTSALKPDEPASQPELTSVNKTPVIGDRGPILSDPLRSASLGVEPLQIPGSGQEAQADQNTNAPNRVYQEQPLVHVNKPGGTISRRTLLTLGVGVATEAVLETQHKGLSSLFGLWSSKPEGTYNKVGVASQKTERATTQPAAEPTLNPTDTPTPSPTPDTPTPVPTLGPEAHGNVPSIDALPVSDEMKTAIEALTQGSEIQIIVRNGLICIDKALMTRPAKIMHKGWGEIPVSQLWSVTLDTQDFPNGEAAKRLEEAFEMGKFDAWKEQTGKLDATFADYMANKNGSYPFEVWAYDGNSTTTKNVPVDRKAFQIIKFKATDEGDTTIDNQALEYDTRVINTARGDVISLGIFVDDPGGVGQTNQFGTPLRDYNLMEWIGAAEGMLSAKAPDSLISGFSLANYRDKTVPSAIDVWKILTNNWIPTTTKGERQIFNITGSKLVR